VSSTDEPATAAAVLAIPPGLDASLALLRHGETEYIVEGRFQGQRETSLTALGRRQAALAGARLAAASTPPALPLPGGPPLLIAHSPLRRTTETAELVASHVAPTSGGAGDPPPPLHPDDGFREIAQGHWEGLHHDEIMARYGDELAAWRRDPVHAWAPGGESIVRVQERVRASLERLLATLAEGREPGSLDRPQVPGYAGAAHGAGVPWAIVVGHDGVFKVVVLTLLGLPLDRFWSFPFALAGISILEIRGGRPALRAHNLVDHLAPLADPTAAAETESRQRLGAL
jgi:broad specificity phosphatase PhoE